MHWRAPRTSIVEYIFAYAQVLLVIYLVVFSCFEHFSFHFSFYKT